MKYILYLLVACVCLPVCMYADRVIINNHTSYNLGAHVLYYTATKTCKKESESIELQSGELRVYNTGDCCLASMQVKSNDDNITVAHGTDDQELIAFNKLPWRMCRNWNIEIMRANENRLKVTVNPM